MGFKLDKIILWGRSLKEYIGMFNLTPDEFNLSILDCGGGPASFNAQMTSQGHKVISCDPIYQFSADEISGRIQETYQTVIDGLKANLANYVWQNIESPEQLGKIRMEAMNQFLNDFPLGLQEGRYVLDELPNLSFKDRQFDLALVSHLLFTYSDHLSLEFHLNSIKELCRVAKEVRIFPLLNISGEQSDLLLPVLQELDNSGYKAGIQQVDYEFQKGGNQLLKVSL
ncbi:SAM-dependent methyltransferase [Chlorogloea sp. CCALA 695]|uniref:SAM-dependent methyltransferase n=1 Tax=Chlorogloea sp. CCALA 695 TaxID=2107693 RepID=UPI000D05DD47|nr:SAM-dependent methyltransferase [Chlorogloea sp. CCALA 695]PSB32144.1 SAM-dependent methyltransferase [Chlorogloea sp. CCALA 695]